MPEQDTTPASFQQLEAGLTEAQEILDAVPPWRRGADWALGHPAFALSVLYVYCCFAGLLFQTLALHRLGLDFLALASPSDLFLGAFTNLGGIVYFFATLGLLLAIYVWRARKRARDSASRVSESAIELLAVSAVAETLAREVAPDDPAKAEMYRVGWEGGALGARIVQVGAAAVREQELRRGVSSFFAHAFLMLLLVPIVWGLRPHSPAQGGATVIWTSAEGKTLTLEGEIVLGTQAFLIVRPVGTKANAVAISKARLVEVRSDSGGAEAKR